MNNENKIKQWKWTVKVIFLESLNKQLLLLKCNAQQTKYNYDYFGALDPSLSYFSLFYKD